MRSGTLTRMEQRISLITLAVRNLHHSRAFYVDGLGWRAELDVPGEVLMIKAGPQLLLSLWDAAHFETEVGPLARGDGAPPITLAHNVAESREVDQILTLARSIGAEPVADAQERAWGGYSGYFADPDGFRWEIAVNPGPIGQIVLPPA